MSIIESMLICSFFVLPFAILFRCIINLHLEQKGIKTSIFHSVGSIVFIISIVAILSLTILPDFRANSGNLVLTAGNFGAVNLVPFKMFADYAAVFLNYNDISFFIINFFGNILFFIPVGLFPCLLWQKFSFKKIIIVSLSFSMFIETVQFFQPERYTDIDDIILNVAGGLTGYLIYYLLNKKFPLFVEKFRIQCPEKFVFGRKRIKRYNKIAD